MNLNPKILVLNSLDDRYGSTVRLKALSSLLSEKYNILFIEKKTNPIEKLWIAIRASFSSYDCLFTQKFNPITLTALFIALIRRKPVVVDWDDWDAGLQSSFIKKLLAFVCEKMGPSFVNSLTTHSPQIEKIAKEKGVSTFYVHQGFYPERYQSKAEMREKTRKELGIPSSQFVVGHLCTFTDGGAKNIETILKAWSKLTDSHYVFVLVGGGPLESKIDLLIQKWNLGRRIIKTGLVPNDQVPKYLSTFDCGLVWMDDTEADLVRVSLKVLEYLAMEIQTVGKVVGETERLFGSLIQNCKQEDLPGRIKTIEKKRLSPKTAPQIEKYSWANAKPVLFTALEYALNGDK